MHVDERPGQVDRHIGSTEKARAAARLACADVARGRARADDRLVPREPSLVGGDPHARPGRPAVLTLQDVPRVALTRSRRAVNLALGRAETARGGGPEPLRHAADPDRRRAALGQHTPLPGARPGLRRRLPLQPPLPALGRAVARRAARHPSPGASFDSRFGQTSGPDAPSECGPFWYRFFRRRPQYVPLVEADPARLRRLRAAVRALGDAAGRPLVFKNLLCTLRLAPIGTALPEARLRRHPARPRRATRPRCSRPGRRSTATTRRGGRRSRPRSTSSARSRRTSRRSSRSAGSRRSWTATGNASAPTASSSCATRSSATIPTAALAAVAAFAKANGFTLARRQAIPAKFDRSGASRLDPALHERVVAYVRAG